MSKAYPLVLAAGMLIGCSGASDADSVESRDSGVAVDQADAGTEAVELRVATLDGQVFDLADHRDSWVLVNYWATWCAPCLKEMPELSELHERHDDIQVIGLAYEETEVEALEAFLEQLPVSYPVALIDVFAPPPAFDVPRGLPMTYLLAPGGRIAQRYLGPVTAEQILQRIAEAGGGEASEAG